MWVPDGKLNAGSFATGDAETKKGASGPLIRVAGRVDLNQTRELVVACQRQSEDEQTDLRELWEELYAHYRMNVPRPDKKDWQSDVYLPELNPAAKRFAASLYSILLRSHEYFTLTSEDPKDEPWIESQKAIIRYHHGQPVRRREDGTYQSRGGVMEIIAEALECSAVFGMAVVKCAWHPKKKRYVEFMPEQWDMAGRGGAEMYDPAHFEAATRRSSGFYAKCVDPRRMWFDEEQTYKIEERLVTAPMLRPLVDAGLYDGKAVDKACMADYGTDEDYDEWRESRGLHESQNPFHKRVHLYEYWGDILDQTGKVVQKNSRVVLANKLHILNPNNLKNPFWHGRDPYIVVTPIRSLFRSVGQSLLEGGLSLQKAIVDMARMGLDGTLLSLLKPLWVKLDRIKNKADIKDIGPLKMFFIEDRADGQIPFGEIPLSSIDPGVLAQMETLRRALQNSTFLSDIHMGISERGDPTATETSIKAKNSQGMMETFARSTEVQLIEPLVDTTRWLALQYWDDFDDPAIAEIGQKYQLPFNASTRAERVRFLTNNIQVRARGISTYFDKANERSQLLELLKIFGASPQFMARLKVRDFMERINDTFLFGSSPDELLIDKNLDKIITQLEQQKTLQMLGGGPQGQQRPQGQPGQGGGPGPSEMQQAAQMMAAQGIDPNSPEGQQVLAMAMQNAGGGNVA